MYYLDKFHIQWCLYTMMDLWHTINGYDYVILLKKEGRCCDNEISPQT